MSLKLIQNYIYQLKDLTDKIIGVLDDAYSVVACSNNALIGNYKNELDFLLDGEQTTYVFEGFTYKAIYSKNKIEYIVFCQGDDENAKTFCQLMAVSITNIKQLYDEKHDKLSFIKNLIMDNVLPSEIYIKTRELHLQNEVSRALFLIRTQTGNDVSAFDIIQSIFPEKTKDFVVGIDESDIVLIKEVKNNYASKELEKIAKIIVDTLSTEAMTAVTVGIGTCVTTIKDLARSYKEAQISLEVGKVFDTEKTIINYESLGIGRLIYQLPIKLCEIFLSEVFKKGSIELLDQETIITIQKFFENNLNVSETSRKLFVHRNTLVYRLEKIKKLTGLDLRFFDQAIVFKVAMMVKKYMNSSTINI